LFFDKHNYHKLEKKKQIRKQNKFIEDTEICLKVNFSEDAPKRHFSNEDDKRHESHLLGPVGLNFRKKYEAIVAEIT
jgi:hypothetical protein